MVKRIAWLETEIARVRGFRTKSTADYWRIREMTEELAAYRRLFAVDDEAMAVAA